MDDDLMMQVYNKEVIALSSQVDAPCRICGAEMAARAVSTICGSAVSVELALKDGKVADFGYEVEACALTKLVVAVMKKAILGKTRREINQAGEELRAMLEKGAPPPGGDWAGLKILAPVIEYKARHNSILLPFEATEKAFGKREA